jgi:hypothetical protein
MHMQECRGEEKGETHTHAHLTTRGVAMGEGARRACEWSVKIRHKASQFHGFVLPFIFATSPCLIQDLVDFGML